MIFQAFTQTYCTAVASAITKTDVRGYGTYQDFIDGGGEVTLGYQSGVRSVCDDYDNADTCRAADGWGQLCYGGDVSEVGFVL